MTYLGNCGFPPWLLVLSGRYLQFLPVRGAFFRQDLSKCQVKNVICIQLNWACLHTISSIKGLSFGSKDYTKKLKTVECTSFLGQTS